MVDDTQIIKLVADKLIENADQYARMDRTENTLKAVSSTDTSVRYQLKDYLGRVIRNAIHVTLNTPAWQANTMSDKLMRLEWQVKVESSNKLSDTQISKLERFSDDVWSQIDEFISNEHGLSGGLDSWNAKHVITRGPLIALYWLYYKESRLVIDCLPVDARWCPYELNEWYCNQTWRSAASIQAEYRPEKIEGRGDLVVSQKIIDSLSGRELEVWNYGDDEMLRVFVGRNKIAEYNNPFKVPTFVATETSTGFQFRSKGYKENESDSFDWLDRNLYDEANRSASIAQTLGMYAFLSSWIQEKKADKVAEPPPAPGEVAAYAEGEGPVRVELGELSDGFIRGAQVIDQAIAQGGVSTTESGDTPGSETAVLTTLRNSLLEEKQKPFRDAIGDFKTKSFRLIMDMYQKLGKIKSVEAEVGVGGMTHRYKASELGDPSTYRVSYEPHLNSKDQNIANVAIAGAQKGLLPTRFILAETLQVQDPDGMLRELEMEKAKALDPSIGLLEQAVAYAEQAEDLSGVDADIANMYSMNLYDSAITILKQRDMMMTQPVAPTTQPQEEPKPNMGGLMALTGPGKGGSNGQAKVTVK